MRCVLKSSLKLLIKLCLFTYILSLTPFFDALPSYLGINLSTITSSVYQYDLDENASSIKEQLNLMHVHDQILMSDEQEDSYIVTESSYVEGKKETKKVYIYNTHQQEEYSDGKTVIDASIQLANLLQEAGVQVIYESNDFKTWLNAKGLNYNYSYHASNYYLNEALVQYGGFDLIIDFHRDSIPRESSYITIDNKTYAKMMFVVGGLSKNANAITQRCNELTSLVNENGVMKNVMIREAYYNQDVSDRMVLIEVGSDKNTYEEVSNSTKLLADSILKYLQG